MTNTKDITKLIMWQKPHALTLIIYKITQDHPKEEIYGLASQVRYASVLVAAMIAEGYKRKTINDTAQFLNIYEGSLDEVTYYLILLTELGLISNNTPMFSLIDAVGNLLYSYLKAALDAGSSSLNAFK